MHDTPTVTDPWLSLRQRVRRHAVPHHMIETATRRRLAGDWAGACAAARVDVHLDLAALAREHGSDLAAQVRSDLRRLAPDLLRWHVPRTAPDGLVRPGTVLGLARYPPHGPPVDVGTAVPTCMVRVAHVVNLEVEGGLKVVARLLALQAHVPRQPAR